MQSTGARPILPGPPPGLPFFAWAIPAECQWRDIAGREPHQPVARALLRSLADPQAEAG